VFEKRDERVTLIQSFTWKSLVGLKADELLGLKKFPLMVLGLYSCCCWSGTYLGCIC